LIVLWAEIQAAAILSYLSKLAVLHYDGATGTQMAEEGTLRPALGWLPPSLVDTRVIVLWGEILMVWEILIFLVAGFGA
jgi:hypothetical protein